MCSDRRPWLIGRHVLAASSVRNAPAEEIAMNMRSSLVGSSRIVWRHKPPAPGAHCEPEPWPLSPGSSCQLVPPSSVRNSAASSTPAYTTSGSVREGSRCHTRLNSQGWGVPSYHWCVPGTPSYSNLFPTDSHVLPPSLDRCICCPNQPVDCDAKSRFGSAGDPFR